MDPGTEVPQGAAAAPGGTMLAMRLAVGLAQGAALAILIGLASGTPEWPATRPVIFDPLVLIVAFVPLLVQTGFGRLSPRGLLAWAAASSALLFVLGSLDAWRSAGPGPAWGGTPWPALRLWLVLPPSLFVAHALVVDAIAQRRFTAAYPRHFDTAWKYGLQGVLAAAFLGVFWIVLWLGAKLFELVGVGFFDRLIGDRYFAWPASGLAIAMAIHVTDVQPGLIRGTRHLALVLLSWLLPLLSIILFAFLGSLPFLSLERLWQTHFATALLLGAAGLLVFLINTCYQDGASGQTTSRAKRLLGSLAALELVPIAALAAWALALRVGQYGWTQQRVLGAALIVLAGCYAFGYAWAALRSGTWLRALEPTNFAAAYLGLAMVFALLTPIADPARLMVADQVDRLRSGTAGASRFDYQALRSDGARWGAAALIQLAENGAGQDREQVMAQAKAALAPRRASQSAGRDPVPSPDAAERVIAVPAGHALPPHLLDEAFGESGPACRAASAAVCTARFLSMEPGRELIFLLDAGDRGGYLLENPDGMRWRVVARVYPDPSCTLAGGGVHPDAVRTVPRAWPDLQSGYRRFLVAPATNPC